MKTNIYNSMLAGGLLLLCGCSDSWDDHYSDRQGQEGRLTLLDQIKTDPELSLFAKMIETAGYGEMLQSSQTFTVWAPTDDALKDMDLTDKAAVARTLANHIARFNISTATPDEEGVKML
ncbi:MAG: fasciclin domain-containing protein, partial [Muribaculaceae bacterium]|nr:fasciclin domain-containing protein [Muribaculaceae bacterium]